MSAAIVVQARDGLWLFGPAHAEGKMRLTAHGIYKTAADASQASVRVPQEEAA